MRFGLVIYGCNNEYFHTFIKGTEKYCRSHGIDLAVYVVGAPNWQPDDFGYHDWSLMKFVNRENLDGAVILTGTVCHFVSKSEIQDIIRGLLPLPLVSINVDVPGIPSVMENPDKAFSYLVEHLIVKHGFRRFAFVSSITASVEIRHRYDIFREVLSKHGIDFDEKNLFYGDYTFYSAQNEVGKIPDKEHVDFDAMVCVTDEMAYGAISALRNMGVSVPDDVVVTGFDNTSFSKSSFPSLTTVDQHIERQGELSAQILHDQTEGKSVRDIYSVETSCKLRKSCGCIHISDMENNSIDENGVYDKEGTEATFNSTLKFLSLQEQMQKVQKQLNRLQGSLSLDELCSSMKEDFINLGITNAAVCIYEKPKVHTKANIGDTPDKARVYFAFSMDEDDNEIPLEYDNGEFFDCSKKLLPASLENEILRGTNTVLTLYHGDLLYGYIIVRLGGYDPFIYTLFCSVIAKSICSAFEVSKKMAENLFLEKSNSDLSLLSRTDEMTGIYNRRGFMEASRKAMDVSASKEVSAFHGLVIFGDMDGLKKINDTYGHDAGDRAIKAEVEVLKKAFRDTDIIGRLGGDEFAILGLSLDYNMFASIKTRVSDLCAEWNRNSGEQFSLSISLGAVEFNSESDSLEKLLKLADDEQYKEKVLKKKSRQN